MGGVTAPTAVAAAAVERFPIRIQRPFGPVLLAFGVREGDRAMVTLDADALDARFGFYRMRVPLSNIASWDITGPYRWYGALGVRRSIRGGDVTYGGSAHGGVQVHFRVPPRWLGVLHAPSLYLTVDDLEGLGAALTARGIPGADLRRTDGR